MASEYYFLSDLHLGGDGELQQCDFATEFVTFLRELAAKGGDAELIIGGDMFGFWELTTVDGPEKFDVIVAHHQAIFDQLRETGKRIRITLMVGNHDYDLACEPTFAGRLEKYNLHLDTATSVKREMLGKTIWIEHGQQVDPYNASPDYGNRYALPVGYFITRTVVAGASRFSAFGKGDWLKDIRSVGTEHIPDWMFSNYFYREMNWAIRGVLTVFLLLLTVTALALVGEIIQQSGLVDVNFLLNNSFTRSLGFVGDILHAILFTNMVILAFMLAVAIPGLVVYFDVRRTLRRFQLTPQHLAVLEESNSNEPYLERARAVFSENKNVAVYLFGHTHDAFLVEEKGKIIVNMGTWLKILRRVPVRIGYLPAVYRPSFRLNSFHIFAEGSRIVIRYAEIAKTPVQELGWLQRLMTFRKAALGRKPIPETTAIETGTAGKVT